MARTDSMTTIDAALEQPESLTPPPEAPQETITPTIAPGLETEAPVTGEKQQKEAVKEAEREQRVAEKSNSERQRMIERAIEQRKQEEEKQQEAFNRYAGKAVDALQNVARGTKVRLSSIPTPGSIALPLILLGVFFLLLIPVNGHTRIAWLWLVLTGNASVQEFQPDQLSNGGTTNSGSSGQSDQLGSGGVSSGQSDQLGSGGVTSNGTTNPGIQPLASDVFSLPAFFGGGTFTGVEGA